MPLRHTSMLMVVLVFTLLALACGGDDDDRGSDEGQPTAEPTGANDTDGGGNGGFGAGTGTLTIGDESWQITGVGCVFTAEEAGNPDFPFNLAGSSESSTGERLQLNAEIYDPTGQERHEGEEVKHQIEIYDFNFEDPTVFWSSYNRPLADVDTVITVDGKAIHGEGVFDDVTTDEIESVPGTMDISC